MLVIYVFCFLALIAAKVHSTALDDYVNAPDANYHWDELEGLGWKGEAIYKGRHPGYTAYMLNMTSQRWLTDADFSPSSQSGSIWYHSLVIIVPDVINSYTNASLWITGGSTGDIPNQDSEDIKVSAALACSAGLVTGALFGIPNEHTIFSADPLQASRTEDAVIAFTWVRSNLNPYTTPHTTVFL